MGLPRFQASLWSLPLNALSAVRITYGVLLCDEVLDNFPTLPSLPTVSECCSKKLPVPTKNHIRVPVSLWDTSRITTKHAANHQLDGRISPMPVCVDLRCDKYHPTL
ncbi:hypothetical protein HMPREF3227_02648 [Corynebacterium sp. CMW7794]|nr:hypothetical protein HMPREF0307_02527 [Corynebacterium sp. DNF00584]KXI15024.1 hypothetical protein HMPREF3227_02648 [Corynebacterium sp. CMW7794]